MKQTINLLGALLFLSVLTACGANDDECKIGNVIIECENADVYNDFISHEQNINASFDKGAKKLTLQEKLELRENLINSYENIKDVLELVFSKVKDSVFGARQPQEIYQMRSEELGFLNEEASRIEQNKAFVKTLNIRKYEVDTVLYEGGKNARYLILEIQNTSDSIISGVAINKVYERNGEDIQPEMVTNYFLSEEMIRPRVEGKTTVLPNDTLIVTLKTSEEMKAKPEVYSFSFLKE